MLGVSVIVDVLVVVGVLVPVAVGVFDGVIVGVSVGVQVTGKLMTRATVAAGGCTIVGKTASVGNSKSSARFWHAPKVTINNPAMIRKRMNNPAGLHRCFALF
jgi:hypothetical protein